MIEAVMTMTELVTRNTDRPKRRNGAAKRDKVHMVADDIVSPNGLAAHLGMTRRG